MGSRVLIVAVGLLLASGVSAQDLSPLQQPWRPMREAARTQLGGVLETASFRHTSSERTSRSGPLARIEPCASDTHDKHWRLRTRP